MRQWLCNIICGSKTTTVVERTIEDEYRLQTDKLRARIAAVRSSLESTDRPNQNTTNKPKMSEGSRVYKTEPKRDNGASAAAKAAEMNDLKAKLLGKKK